MRRSLAIVFTMGLLLFSSLALATGASATTTIGATTRCSNGEDNTGGLGLICQTTIVNTFTGTGGSAVVTVREATALPATRTRHAWSRRTPSTEPVTTVRQCNGSINGGGGTLRCSVRVVNNFVGTDVGRSAVTTNQCVGSGGGITTGCDPFPATTTGAAITQCNGSANGGTLVGLTCTTAGSQSSTHRVTINQCNGSANGGGALVTARRGSPTTSLPRAPVAVAVVVAVADRRSRRPTTRPRRTPPRRARPRSSSSPCSSSRS